MRFAGLAADRRSVRRRVGARFVAACALAWLGSLAGATDLAAQAPYPTASPPLVAPANGATSSPAMSSSFLDGAPVWDDASLAFPPDPLSREELLTQEPLVGEPLVGPRQGASCDPIDLSSLEVGFLARGYFVNDQRIEFTGQEDTFGVEGVLDMGWSKPVGEGTATAYAQFFLNQPFDRNVLVDTPYRASYASNFDVEPLEISQLYLRYSARDWNFTLGKFMTPFGRVHYPIYTNDFRDSPFIRTEAILWRETGVMVEKRVGEVLLTSAITNGSLERDTNSSKALVARVGWDRDDRWAVGSSIKLQDGVGSEGQKEYKEHVGFDGMLRLSQRWTLSGEFLFDRYGIRRPGFPLDDIFWGRSYYNRQLNAGYHDALSGIGYYLDLGYQGDLWTLDFNYGEFRPNPIGDPVHDTNNHRGLVKAIRHVAPGLDLYSIVLMENRLYDPDLQTYRKGFSVWAGVQWAW